MKLRRILTVFVAVLLISLAAVVTASADEGQFEIAVGVSSSTAILKDGRYNVAPGDEIELTVSISENPGIDSFQINIKYNPELVTPVVDANNKLIVDGILLPNFDVSIKNSGDEITFVRYSSVNGSSTTNATGSATIKFKVTDTTCEDILFTVSEVSAVKSVAGSIFPYVYAVDKDELNGVLNNNVFLAHSFELADTTAPTCTDDGILHYACAECDATLDKVGAPATGHTPVREDDKQTSCSEPGYIGATTCSVCNVLIHDRQEIPTIDHHVVDVEGKAATCTEEGLSDGKQCSVCKAWIEEQVVIPTVDHTPVDVEGKPATCTENGLTDGKSCSVCNEVIEAQVLIPAAHGKLRDENGDKVCSVCGVVVEKKQVQPTEPATESETEPVTEAPTSADDEGKSRGCGSAIGFGAIAVIIISFVCVPVFKKRKF